MPRNRNRVPSYRLHRASGQAIVTLDGRDHYLGAYGSVESQEEYDRLIAEWLAKRKLGTTSRVACQAENVTINELFLAYWRHAEKYYVKDCRATTEQQSIKYATKPLIEFYGSTEANEFGPRALKSVRARMMERDCVRSLVNKQIGRIRRMFKWGVENELVRAEVLYALQAVSPLKRGRCSLRESEPVRPIADDHIEAVLEHVSSHVAAMIRLQCYTGMRPGEVVIMRSGDIHSDGDIWTYTPAKHKTEHHGHRRLIHLGPKAQGVVEPFVNENKSAYLFSPAASERTRRKARHCERITPMSCGNRPGSNRKSNPKRRPRDRYTVNSYRRAIHRACDRAFAPPGHLGRQMINGECGTRIETMDEWKARLGSERWQELRSWWRAHAMTDSSHHSPTSTDRREDGDRGTLTIRWSESENILWKVPLPGNGHSTPIVWGERIYLTAAVPHGEETRPRYSGRPGAHNNLPVTQPRRFVVLAVDRNRGDIVWHTTVHDALPHEGGHETASLASASPVTDGEHLFAFFGSYGLFCLDMDGNVIWQTYLGDMHTKHGHGEGASPALYKDTLIVNWDHEGQSFVTALEKDTGRQRWRQPRDEPTSWATPIVAEYEGRAQVIVGGTNRIRSYGLETGEVIWTCEGLSANIVASPVLENGIIIAGSSYNIRAMLAIQIDGAQGDITGSDNVLWRRTRGTPYVPSPLLYHGKLYFLNHYQGILSRVDALTGGDLGGPYRLPGSRPT